MSWSIKYAAQGKANTKQIANTNAYLPDAIKSLIVSAVDGVEGHDDAVFLVEGMGHHAGGKGSYNVSTVQLKVEPVTLTLPPA